MQNLSQESVLLSVLSSRNFHIFKWRNGCLFDHSVQVGVQIFTRRTVSDDQAGQMNPDSIIKYLHKYQQATLLYLEHLVLERRVQVKTALQSLGSIHPVVYYMGVRRCVYMHITCVISVPVYLQKEKLHTHLAVLYLDRVLGLLSQSPSPAQEVAEAREQLQKLLKESNLYRVQLLLGECWSCSANRFTRFGCCWVSDSHSQSIKLLLKSVKFLGVNTQPINLPDSTVTG